MYGMRYNYGVQLMKNKKYLLFDLDGTLTDPKIGITKSVAYALGSFGIHVDDLDALTPFIGPPLWDSFMRLYSFTREQAEEAVKKYREVFSVTGKFENCLYDGIDDLLSRAAKTKTLIVATSKPTVFTEEILKHFKIRDYFSFISGSELDGTRAHKDEVIKYAVEMTGITDKSEAVMIGDTKFDIIGANKNEMDSIGVLYGYGSRAELEDAGAGLIAASVGELREILE